MIRVLVYLVPIALAVYALIDCIQTEDRQVRGLPKLAWIALIVLIWVIGPLAWLIAGRQRGTGRRPWLSPDAGSGPSPTGRPVAPDDDPEFLRGLGTRGPDQQPSRASQEKDELLDQWERERRRRDGDPDEPGDEPKA